MKTLIIGVLVLVFLGCMVMPARIKGHLNDDTLWRYDEILDEMTGEVITRYAYASSENMAVGWGGEAGRVELQVHCGGTWIMYFDGKFRASKGSVVDGSGILSTGWRFMVSGETPVTGNVRWDLYGAERIGPAIYYTGTGDLTVDHLQDGRQLAIEITPWDRVSQRVDWLTSGFQSAYANCKAAAE